PASSLVSDGRILHTISGRKYGWLSRLRSYLIIDPLIWLYTLVLGTIVLIVGLFDPDGRRQHRVASAWSWLIAKTMFSPVKVTSLDKVDTSRAYVYAVN